MIVVGTRRCLQSSSLAATVRLDLPDRRNSLQKPASTFPADQADWLLLTARRNWRFYKFDLRNHLPAAR